MNITNRSITASLPLLVFLMTIILPLTEGYCRIIGHDISLELDLKSHSIHATDTLTIGLEAEDTGGGTGERKVAILLNRGLEIESVRAGSQELVWKRPDRKMSGGPEETDLVEIYLPRSLEGEEAALKLSYHGILSGHEPLPAHGAPLASSITPEFVYLTPGAHWYADLPGGSLSAFRVGARVPSGYEVVTHGKLTGKRKEGKTTFFRWEADYPSDSCFLIAARYKVTHDVFNDIDLYTFFFPGEQGLSESYIDATKGYLKMYEEMFGPYPFSKFAVVENVFPTGYGMPSYTLLGRAALKLPFIVHISLGHEIAHSWWGNSVFTHPDHGNWCEGLTTYVADYHYKELINPESAMEYRRDILRRYADHIREDNDFPLEGFTEGSVPRTEKAVRAVLYGKCAMVFHMLKRLVGPEPFLRSLRQVCRDRKWKQTTWDDFRRIFEEVSGRDLDWFFRQWVYRKGAPMLELGDAKVVEVEKGGPYRVDFELSQSPSGYRLLVPVVLTYAGGKKSRRQLEMQSSHQKYSLLSESRPGSLHVDPGADVFRRLIPEEIPPILDKVLGDRELLIVYPASGPRRLVEEYRALSERLRRHALIKSDAEVKDEDLSRSIFLLGGPENNLVVKKLLKTIPSSLKLEDRAFVLNGTRYDKEETSLLFCLSSPFKKGRTVCIFSGLSPDAVGAAGHKLIHYGKYSYVLFVDGVSTDKGVFPKTEDPLSVAF